MSSAERLEGFDAPTLKESGLDVETQNWRMVAGAPGISDADKTALVDTVEKMVESDPWKNIVSQKGWQNTFLAGAEFETYLAGEIEKTSAVLKSLGLAQ